MKDILQTAEVIEACENLLQKRRPQEEIRHKVDLAYRIDNQSVLIFEIRSKWNNPKEFIENPIAKTTWVNTRDHWKVFWLRADLKWHGYKPVPYVKSIYDFIELVDKDKHGCFWG
jgi:hypothetical protein